MRRGRRATRAAGKVVSKATIRRIRNTATLGLAGADILRLLRHWGHEPLLAAIPVQH